MDECYGRYTRRYLGGWVLDEAGEPVPEPDLHAAWSWREAHPEHVKLARDELPQGLVSTVLLPMDHQFGDGPPLLWETMVFAPGQPYDEHTRRHATRAAALECHTDIVARLRSGRPLSD